MPHPAARLRLLALWIVVSLQAGVLAVVATFALSTLQSSRYASFNPPAIAGAIGLSCLPALILAPLIGALAGSSRAWQTMVAASAVSAGVIAWAAFVPDAPWLSVLGIVALASSFIAAAALRLVYSLLSEARLRSTTAMVLFGIGLFAMLPLGIQLGVSTRREASVALAVLVLTAAGLVRVRPQEFVPLAQGIVGPFAAGVGGVFRVRPARNALIGLWFWTFVAAAITVCLIRLLIASDDPRAEAAVENFTMRFTLAIIGGVLLTTVNRNAYRFGWLIFYSAIAIFVCLLWLRMGESADGPLIGIGIALGAAFPPLVHYYFTSTAPKYHGAAAALLLAGGCAAGLALAGVAASLDGDASAARRTMSNVLLAITSLTAVLSVFCYYRPALEGTAELFLWPVYRVRAVGPGVANLPGRGPCLVIGNHAAWFDPLFLAKVLPLPTTPMMTSKFYDLPVLSWLMRHVIGTIRVPEMPYRHEAPELKEAVAALDRGECIVLFPEGYLRRKEEQPLRRFGRGVWKILSDRPATPTFACWIEGNWGSYFSYRGGPPTKGKRIDCWKRIDIGIIGPLAIDAAMLADHMATRLFLMQQVAAAREPLGLPPIDLRAAHAEGEKE